MSRRTAPLPSNYERDTIFGNTDLTSTERAITALVFQGRTNAQIAAEIQTTEDVVQSHLRRILDTKRLTNTPVRRARSVLKCPDDRKNRVVSAQATYPCGSSKVGSRVCEQRYAAERVLPGSRFELQHSGSPSKETALEEKA